MRAVQVSEDLAAHVVAGLDQPPPDTMADSFRRLADDGVLPQAVAERMIAAVSFRNVAIHAYQTIDWAIVLSISHTHLDDFRAFAEAVVTALPDP